MDIHEYLESMNELYDMCDENDYEILDMLDITVYSVAIQLGVDLETIVFEQINGVLQEV